MNEIVLISSMAMATFLTRYSMFALSKHIELLPIMVKALNYVPPTILSALILPDILLSGNGDSFSFSFYSNPRFVSATVAFLVAWFSRKMFLTILAGMFTLLSWQWLMGIMS